MSKLEQDFSQEEYNLNRKPLNLKTLKKSNILLENYSTPVEKLNYTQRKLPGLPSIQTSKVKNYKSRVNSRYFSHHFFKNNSVSVTGKTPIK